MYDGPEKPEPKRWKRFEIGTGDPGWLKEDHPVPGWSDHAQLPEVVTYPHIYGWKTPEKHTI